MQSNLRLPIPKRKIFACFLPPPQVTVYGKILKKRVICLNYTYAVMGRIKTISEMNEKRGKTFLTLFSLPILLSVIGLFFVFEASYVRSFGREKRVRNVLPLFSFISL